MKERVICAAIRVEWEGFLHVFAGHRHHTIMHLLHDLDAEHWAEVRRRGLYEQGFITTRRGRFVSRAEARILAVAAGQADPEKTHHARDLFSEDLY